MKIRKGEKWTAAVKREQINTLAVVIFCEQTKKKYSNKFLSE